MNEETTDLVSILVPKQHLSRVYGFIATLDDSAVTTIGAAATEEAKSWTDDLLRRQYAESPKSIKRFQQLLASKPGEWTSTEAIAKELNAPKGPKTIAGALGAYGRRTSNRYGMKTWPFNTQWNHVEGQQYYSMTPEVAEIIRSL